MTSMLSPSLPVAGHNLSEYTDDKLWRKSYVAIIRAQSSDNTSYCRTLGTSHLVCLNLGGNRFAYMAGKGTLLSLYFEENYTEAEKEGVFAF